jgi:pyruvate carboxylase
MLKIQEQFHAEGGKRVEVYQSAGVRECDSTVWFIRDKNSTEYDSLMVKMTVRGFNWEQTIQRLKRSLEGFLIVGPKSTVPFYLAICDEPDFQAGNSIPVTSKRTLKFSITRKQSGNCKTSRLIAETHAKKINPYAY